MADLPKIDVFLLNKDCLSVIKIPTDRFTYDAISFELHGDNEALKFDGLPEHYIIENPSKIKSDGREFKSEIVKTIDVLFDEDDILAEKDLLDYVLALFINDDIQYYKTTQVDLTLEKPFLAAEQHFLRFKFDKKCKGYDLFLSTTDPETNIAFFYQGQKKDASMVYKVKDIKIVFRRNHPSGEYIVSVKCNKPSMIAAYARLTRSVYRYAQFSDSNECGAFWKNDLDNDFIAELVSSENEENWVIARWYVPPRFCRFLKMFFHMKSKEEENSKLNVLYKCSDVVSIVLGIIGLIGPKSGVISLVAGTVFNAMKPQELFEHLEESVDSLGGFQPNYDVESLVNGTYRYGCVLEYRGKSSGIFYNTVENNYGIQRWEESEKMVSPDGENGTWIDGSEYIHTMIDMIKNLYNEYG